MEADRHLVLELDLAPATASVQDRGQLVLRSSVHLSAVRTAYRARDLHLHENGAARLTSHRHVGRACTRVDGRDASAQATGCEGGAGARREWANSADREADEESGAQGETRPATAECVRFEEYAWLADDFDDLLSRRRAADSVQRARLGSVHERGGAADDGNLFARDGDARASSSERSRWTGGGSLGPPVRGSTWRPPLTTYPDVTRRTHVAP